MDSASTAGPSSQPIASGSTPRPPSPPPPAVLPFAPPPLPKTHLTGSLDLLSHLSLLPSYDTYVRPYFRNPKAPVALPPGTGSLRGVVVPPPLTADEKGKGRATAGRGGGGGGVGGQQPQQQARKDKVVDLKKMRGDYDDLVEECVVLTSDHRSILQPPTSFFQLAMEAPEGEGPGYPPLWTDSLRILPPEQLEQWGWRLMEGRLPEAGDESLFVRIPKQQPEKKKKKNKRPRPSDDLLLPSSSNNNNGGQALSTGQDSNKRRKENGGGAMTPRTPGINIGTPGGSA